MTGSQTQSSLHQAYHKYCRKNGLSNPWTHCRQFSARWLPHFTSEFTSFGNIMIEYMNICVRITTWQFIFDLTIDHIFNEWNFSHKLILDHQNTSITIDSYKLLIANAILFIQVWLIFAIGHLNYMISVTENFLISIIYYNSFDTSIELYPL